MGLNTFIESLQNSSRLVSKWSRQRPPGRASVQELLTVEGISVWDMMAAELALFLIPDGLAKRKRRESIWQLLVPYFRLIKYAFWKKAPVNTGDCSKWPSGNTALFLGFTPYMARDVLQPVIDLMLKEDGLVPVLLLESPPATGSVAVHSVQGHRSLETVNEARELAKAIRKASSILCGNDSYRQLFADSESGSRLWPKVKHGVTRAFWIRASIFLPDTIAVARHILTTHRPAVIVSIDVADPRTRVYSLIGKTMGIPTVQVQSGPVDQGVVEWRFLLDDVVVAQGNQAKDVFLSHGVPPEKIHVLGSPRYDNLTKANEKEIGAFRQRFNVAHGNRTVVFASSYSLDIFENNLAEAMTLLKVMKKAMFEAVAAVPGVTLIVKPHPLENVEETKALVGDHSRIKFALPREDIRPLIAASDALFTLGSTCTLDGLILGKPTICPAFPGWGFCDLFIETGAVQGPRSQIEIVESLQEIVADAGLGILQRHAQRRSEYLTSVVRDEGKGATRRITDLLNALGSGQR